MLFQVLANCWVSVGVVCSDQHGDLSSKPWEILTAYNVLSSIVRLAKESRFK